MPNPDLFRRDLLNLHGIDDAELEQLWNEVKNYRDDFVTHLEDQETTQIPNLNVPYLLVSFYFRALQSTFPALRTTSALSLGFDRYYDERLAAAKGILQHVNSV